MRPIMTAMTVLIIGSGGREHALAIGLSQGLSVGSIHTAPGNAGTATLGTNHQIDAMDIEGLVSLAQEISADLVVVGPEGPLVAGISDRLREIGIPSFGPGATGAMLEGSKTHAKDLMRKLDIPTADSVRLDKYSDIEVFLHGNPPPWVIKRDVLAAGKGVVVTSDIDDASKFISDSIEGDGFVIAEEFLHGEEASLLVLIDESGYVCLPPSQDHKRAREGDKGPNTGGMGAYAPAPLLDAEGLEELRRIVLEPTLKALRQRGIDYRGVIYAGLMITADGPQVIEFNCRFGDPECQTLMPLLGPEIGAVLQACALGRLDLAPQLSIAERCSACVVAAAEGYPEAPRKGDAIRIALAPSPDHQLFHAGTHRDSSGELLTAGGRVLAIVAQGNDFDTAFAGAYNGLNQLDYAGIIYRRDIGHQVRSGG